MVSCECECEVRVYVTRSKGKQRPTEKRPKAKGDPKSNKLPSNEKQPRMGKRPNTAKPKEDPNFIEFPSVGKLSLGNDPNPAKTQEDTGSRKGVKPWTMEEIWEMFDWFDHVNGIGRPSPSERTPKPTSTREKFAIAALSYLRKEGHNLKLVEACSYEKKGIKMGYRVHINFKARRIDCVGKSIIVECCVSLGESDSLPNEPNNPGCGICTKAVHHLEGKPINVHHPEGGCKGIIWGLLRWSESEEVYYYI